VFYIRNLSTRSPKYVAIPDIPSTSKCAATNAHVNCEHPPAVFIRQFAILSPGSQAGRWIALIVTRHR
jgi:hypothetical protein